MSSPSTNITSVLKETRQFAPSADVVAQAHIKSLAEYEMIWKRAKEDPQGFWGR
jgi:acetyl-CoA synthetase